MINFLYDWKINEWIFLASFALLYLLYVIKIVRLQKRYGGSIARILPKLILRFSYIALIIMAILGPHTPSIEAPGEVKAISKDIYVLLDLSLSMNATDVPPSRLERVKHELKKLIKNSPGDRFALMVFSNEAFVQCPLTYDRKALYIFLDAANSNLVPRTGTSFDAPLQLVLNKLEQENVGKEANARLVLLISDGEDFGDKTSSIASKLVDKGVKILTLGVGSENGGIIPEGNRYKKDKSGNQVITRLEPEALKELASKSNGVYFELSDQKNEVPKLMQYINNLKGEVRDTLQIGKNTDLKPEYFLIIALFLILIDLLLSIKLFKLL